MRRSFTWATGTLAVLGLVLVIAAASLWWWAGQEGSLEWTLRRVTQGQPLETEGVEGSLRSGWRIKRLAWERDGLRLEAEDIVLEWQPLAMLNRTVRIDELRVGLARVIDERAKTSEPFTLPSSLGIPWRVTVDEVAVARIEYRGGTTVDARSLAGRYAFDGLRHRLDLRSLQFAGGTYGGEATLLASRPFTLDAQLAGRFQAKVPNADDTVTLVFEARADGRVDDFEAAGQLKVAQGAAATGELPSATVTARVTPFEGMPVPSAHADFRQLDVAQFWPSAPQTLLSGQLQVRPAGTGTWQLSADVRNALPGAWDQGRLPVAQARADGQWRSGRALIESLKAQIGKGTVEGSGAWEGDEGWRFEGRVSAVDPAQLHTQLASLPLRGNVKLDGEGEAVAFDVGLQAEGGAVRRAGRPRGQAAGTLLAAAGAFELREVAARGRWEGGVVDLPLLRVRTSDAALDGKLQLQVQARSGSGRLQLRAPGLEATADGALSESRGKGTAQVVARDAASALAWLRRWPQLAETLQWPVRGAAEAQVAWQGGWADPTVDAVLKTSGLQVGAAAAEGVAAPLPWSVRGGEARLQGRLRDARLDLLVLAERGQRKVDVRATGRAGRLLAGRTATWRGQVASLAVQLLDPAIADGPWQLQLRNAVDWRWAGEGFALDGGEAVLQAPAMRGGAPATQAVLSWTPVRREAGTLHTAGRLSGLPLAWVELFGGPQLAGSALAGDMVFDAQWDAQLGSTVRVNASLARVRGDVTVLAETADGRSARVAAGVREARIDITSQGEDLTLALLWDSEQAGHAEGQVRTRLVRTAGGWEWPAAAPIAGRVQAQLPRIGVWSLLAPPGWRLRGSLVADISVGGTRAQPELSGPLRADDLALRSVVDGIELRDGRLRAQLEGQRLVVSEFVLRGGGGEEGGGTLVAYGEGSWTRAGLQLEVNAQLSQLRASLREDRQLTVSGPLQARVDARGTAITGQLSVDRARIVVPDETPPRLGDDVVVRNAPGVAATQAQRSLRPAPTGGGRTVTLAISVDLGSDFRVAGRGLDTRLAGSLQVEGRSLALPRLEGTIRTRGGTYEGYGQRMAIERGELRFTGPADNPALDILALRPNLSQRVGVLVTGRAQAPHVELYSEGGMSEAETLSWLVLGRSSSGGGAETALLQRAATALLAGRRGSGKGFAGSLGLDDVSVRRDDTAGPLVRLGKRFGDRFYAAYERSLSGAMGTLYIFYDISRRLTLRAEAGERSGMDLIFTFLIDRPKR